MSLTMLLIVLLVSAMAVVLVMALSPDSVQRAVRERLSSTMAVEEWDDLPRKSRLVKALDALEPINKTKQLANVRRSLGNRLISGHVPLSASHFLGLKESVAVLAAIIYGATTWPKTNWLVLAVIALVSFMIPDLWLRSHIKARQRAISRDLPEVVDLLNLCVQAGTDFMGAMGRVIKEFRRCALIEELSIVMREIRVGKRRRDALRALANRVKTPEMSSLVRTLVQADRMGTGIAEALRIQSEESRLHRYHTGERLAQQAPLKMLIPLIFFIMPTVGIIVAGPIMIQFMRGDLIPKM